MRRQSIALAVPVTVSTGAESDITLFGPGADFSFLGTFIGVYHFEVMTFAGTWHQVGADIDSERDFLPVPNGARQARIRCSVYTSGTPVAVVAGTEL